MQKRRYWSYTFEIGINKFDGDIRPSGSDLTLNSFQKLTFGVSAERSFTPIWGVGAEFYYLPMRASSDSKAFESTMFHFNPYISLNFMNLLEFKPSKWQFTGTFGIGLAYYNSTLYKSDKKFDEIKNGMAVVIPVGGILEYQLSNSISLGAKIQYRSHNKDNLEGSNKSANEGGYNFKGISNDFVAIGTFFVRLRLGARIEERVSNVSPDLQMNEALSLAREAMKTANDANIRILNYQNKIDSLQLVVDSLNKTVGTNLVAVGVLSKKKKNIDTTSTKTVDFLGQSLSKDSVGYEGIYSDKLMLAGNGKGQIKRLTKR
jgi:opacity protein-like surface antigen